MENVKWGANTIRIFFDNIHQDHWGAAMNNSEYISKVIEDLEFDKKLLTDDYTSVKTGALPIILKHSEESKKLVEEYEIAIRELKETLLTLPN